MTTWLTQPFTEPPFVGDEHSSILGSLERLRATFAWKCADLNDEELRRRLSPSTMTLGGLLKHMAYVEEFHFSYRLLGRDFSPSFPQKTFEDDPDWEWTSANDESAETLYSLWIDSVSSSREIVNLALENGGLDQLVVRPWRDGTRISLRRSLFDLIEEYARHIGHADLLRESIDGRVGEDPPRN